MREILSKELDSLLRTLLIVFVTLRLAGLVAWSWLWVLSPLWGGLLLSVVVFFVKWWLLKRAMRKIR